MGNNFINPSTHFEQLFIEWQLYVRECSNPKNRAMNKSKMSSEISYIGGAG